MGMFFYVKADPKELCPYCGSAIRVFQSKDSIGEKHDVWGSCCGAHPTPLPTLEKSEVENYYESCESCKKWVEYKNTENGAVLLSDKE